ncbi:MAG: RNA polymerase sigma-70 factor [Cyclobacteriaceae bacterium]
MASKGANREYLIITKRDFEKIYDENAQPLFRFINSRIRNKEASEEIIQDLFLSLWEKRNMLEVQSSFPSYLFGAARYKILDYIRSESVRAKYAEEFKRFFIDNTPSTAEGLLHLKELQFKIDSSLSQLPPKCQKAFRLSRMEHKSIYEIAEEMHISKRTVENYITQALSHLRDVLFVLMFLARPQ